jgi:hypothetical protein
MAKLKRNKDDEFIFFERQKSKFSWVAKQARFISSNIGVHVATPLQGYATWLFIRACVTSVSLTKLFDEQETSNEKLQYLDHPSIAALARALIENITVLIYFSDTALSENEWLCRKHIIDLHDAINRGQFLAQIDPSHPPPPKKLLERLRKKLTDNPAFMTIPTARRKRLLDGEDMFIEGRHQAMLVFGWGDQMTRGIYKYLSSHAHSTALAFHRTEANQLYAPRSPASHATAGFAVEFASSALGRGCMHMLGLFPYVEAIFDPLVLAGLKKDYADKNS